MKKVVRLGIRIKDCEEVFDEELRPGEIAMQEIIFDEEPETYEGGLFLVHLLGRQEDFLKEHVEVTMEEVPVD